MTYATCQLKRKRGKNLRVCSVILVFIKTRDATNERINGIEKRAEEGRTSHKHRSLSDKGRMCGDTECNRALSPKKRETLQHFT